MQNLLEKFLNIAIFGYNILYNEKFPSIWKRSILSLFHTKSGTSYHWPPGGERHTKTKLSKIFPERMREGHYQLDQHQNWFKGSTPETFETAWSIHGLSWVQILSCTELFYQKDELSIINLHRSMYCKCIDTILPWTILPKILTFHHQFAL